jgi:hypothetical protein
MHADVDAMLAAGGLDGVVIAAAEQASGTFRLKVS